jgi:hypothetical protein
VVRQPPSQPQPCHRHRVAQALLPELRRPRLNQPCARNFSQDALKPHKNPRSNRNCHAGSGICCYRYVQPCCSAEKAARPLPPSVSGSSPGPFPQSAIPPGCFHSVSVSPVPSVVNSPSPKFPKIWLDFFVFCAMLTLVHNYGRPPCRPFFFSAPSRATQEQLNSSFRRRASPYIFASVHSKGVASAFLQLFITQDFATD